MSDIKEKIESELKPIKSMCETMENAIKTQLDKGLDKVNTHEMYEAVDIYKDLSEVKKNIIDGCYKMQIMEAMEESQYGEDYDYRGRMGFNPRMRMMPEYEPYDYMEQQRMFDMMDGRMGYNGSGNQGGTSGRSNSGSSQGGGRSSSGSNRMGFPEGRGGGRGGNRGGSSGGRGGSRGYDDGYTRYGFSHDKFMEDKQMYQGNDPESKRMRMESLSEAMDEFEDNVSEMVEGMTPEEKQTWKNRMNRILSM